MPGCLLPVAVPGVKAAMLRDVADHAESNQTLIEPAGIMRQAWEGCVEGSSEKDLPHPVLPDSGEDTLIPGIQSLLQYAFTHLLMHGALLTRSAGADRYGGTVFEMCLPIGQQTDGKVA